MIRKILVALDGSEFSTAAVELAVGWARRFGAELVGLGIVDAPTISRGELVSIGGTAFKRHREETLLADAWLRVERFLRDFGDTCREAGVAWRILEDVGLPHAEIVLEAQAFDLVVLGQETHFHFETQRGSCETLERVLKDAPRPVVTAPRRLSGGSSLMIAYDGSLQAARALQMAHALGLSQDGLVHVVTVAKSDAEGRRIGKRAIEFLAAHEVEATLYVDEAPAAAAAKILLRRARELDAKLVVMGAYGQPSLKEFLLGSVTKTVLREATVPLLLHH